MKILLVNEQGHTVASLEDLERYDGGNPAHFLALLDILETLIATAKRSHGAPGSVDSSVAGSADGELERGRSLLKC